MKRVAWIVFAVGFATTLWSAQARAAELVFFMSEACGICERWQSEIGGVYPKTEEAKVLPLRVQSVHDDLPEDLSFVKGVAFTPTFVVVEDGQEIGRMVGYISDYFFWEQIGGLVKQVEARKSSQPTGTAACASGDTSSAPC